MSYRRSLQLFEIEKKHMPEAIQRARAELATDVSFKDGDLSVEGVRELKDGLLNPQDSRRGLRGLDLTSIILTQELVEELAAILQTNTTLQRLDLTRCGLNNDLLLILVNGICSNPGSALTEVRLGLNALCAEAVPTIARLLRHLTLIESLDLSNTELGNAGASSLAFELYVAFRSAGELNTEFLPRLRRLDLSSNHIGKNGIRVLSSALSLLPELQILDLSGNRLRNKGVKYLTYQMRANSTLIELNLANNQICISGSNHIAKWMRKTCRAVTRLVLDHNPLTNNGINAITTAIMFRGVTMELFSICGCHMGGGLGLDGVALLLRKYLVLNLNVADNLLSDANFQVLLNEMPDRGFLRSLNAADNALGLDSMKALSLKLASDTALTSLDLSANVLSDDGFKLLSTALAQNRDSEVKSLDVSGNFIAVLDAKLIPQLRLAHLNMSRQKDLKEAEVKKILTNPYIRRFVFYQTPAYDNEAIVDQLRNHTQGNHDRRQQNDFNYMGICVLVAFCRANLSHPFRSSILPLIPGIIAMARPTEELVVDLEGNQRDATIQREFRF